MSSDHPTDPGGWTPWEDDADCEDGPTLPSAPCPEVRGFIVAEDEAGAIVVMEVVG